MTTWIDALMDRLPDIINALAPGFLLLTFFYLRFFRGQLQKSTIVAQL